MNILEQLQTDYRLHKKSRNGKHKGYPDRFPIPDDKVSWKIAYPEYQPVTYNAPVVLDPKTTWADPADIHDVKRMISSFEGNLISDTNSYPLNPFGRTGLRGRGVLGKWGPNKAVDGLITTFKPGTNHFEVLTIIRKDSGETAFPGGMIDEGETDLQARNRELKEELSIDYRDLSQPLYEKIVKRCYVDDPRNTDHAWIETTVFHTHLSYENASKMQLTAGDDATAFRWTAVTPESIRNFYASHGLVLMFALKEMSSLNEEFIISFRKLNYEDH